MARAPDNAPLTRRCFRSADADASRSGHFRSPSALVLVVLMRSKQTQRDETAVTNSHTRRTNNNVRCLRSRSSVSTRSSSCATYPPLLSTRSFAISSPSGSVRKLSPLSFGCSSFSSVGLSLRILGKQKQQKSNAPDAEHEPPRRTPATGLAGWASRGRPLLPLAPHRPLRAYRRCRP